jgi:hypothetical protein
VECTGRGWDCNRRCVKEWLNDKAKHRYRGALCFVGCCRRAGTVPAARAFVCESYSGTGYRDADTACRRADCFQNLLYRYRLHKAPPWSRPPAVSASRNYRRSRSAEAELAVCEYSGCAGITPDIALAVSHARDAAEKGSIDAMIGIGPHLSASQIDPDEVAAWKLVNASLQQQGCAGNGFSVRWMNSTTNTLASSSISARARTIADQYWRDHGPQMKGNLGCTS